MKLLEYSLTGVMLLLIVLCAIKIVQLAIALEAVVLFYLPLEALFIMMFKETLKER